MRHKNSTKLFGYWDRLRAGRYAPKREEIEPSDIREMLGDTFILDVSSTLRTISYRLAGTRLCAAYGKELKGQGFLVPWEEADCFEVTRMLGKVYRDYKPHLVSSIGKTNSGKFVEFETLLLPIQPIDEANNRILGITTTEVPPFWLGAEPIESMGVVTIRAINNIQTDSLATSVAPDISPEYPVFDTNIGLGDEKAEGTRRVAHLTVHDGGKI